MKAMASAAMVVLGISAAGAATVVNGDFEDELAVGWTVEGSQAELLANRDEDADDELYIHWLASTAITPPVFETDVTTVSQTIPLDNLDEWFTFRYRASATYENWPGAGFGYAEVKVSLLDPEMQELANRTYSERKEWTTALIDLSAWIASEEITETELYLKISAKAIGTAPVKPGYTAGSHADLDDVMFVSDPGEKETWTIF